MKFNKITLILSLTTFAIPSFAADLSNIDTRVTNNETILKLNTNNINANGQGILSLQTEQNKNITELDSHSEKIKAIDVKSTNNETILKLNTNNIDANGQGILNLQSKQDASTSNIDANGKSIINLQSKQDGNSKDIKEIASGYASNETRLRSYQSNINDRISSTANNISSNTAKINTNSAQIRGNSHRISTLENSLNRTNKELDAMGAMSMAQSQLFQPYGVGNINITAGVGHYEDSNAMAVGVGYRVTDKLAFRGSVSANDLTSKLAVGAGFDYEL